MDEYLDPEKECIIFDLDATLVDIERRLNVAPGSRSDGTRTMKQYDIVLSGELYYLDEPIPVALAYLHYLNDLNKYNIIYLSGRRQSTIKQTRDWLFGNRDEREILENGQNNNGNFWKFHKFRIFPDGYIIHRMKGMKGNEFKEQYLRILNEHYNIVAYFGDRLVDDCFSAIQANIRPVLVLANEWLYLKHICNGLSSVIEDIEDEIINPANKRPKQRDRSYTPQYVLNTIKNSQYYNMSYNDLIPIEFATELWKYYRDSTIESDGDSKENDDYVKKLPGLPIQVKRKEKHYGYFLTRKQETKLLLDRFENENLNFNNLNSIFGNNNNKNNINSTVNGVCHKFLKENQDLSSIQDINQENQENEEKDKINKVISDGK